MRKRIGKQFTFYLPDGLVAKAKVMADERDKSTSHIVACALRQYLAPKDNAPAARTVEASSV